MFDFGGLWSMTLKNRGQLKKTEGWTVLKSKDSSLAVGTYPQRGSPPPQGISTPFCLVPLAVIGGVTEVRHCQEF